MAREETDKQPVTYEYNRDAQTKSQNIALQTPGRKCQPKFGKYKGFFKLLIPDDREETKDQRDPDFRRPQKIVHSLS